MKGKFGPYIKYKSLNATIPEEKDPNDITMEDAIILIEKRKDYDRNKKQFINFFKSDICSNRIRGFG